MSEKDRSKHTFWAKEIIRLAEKREHDRVETEIAAIPEIVPKQENLRKNEKYKDYIPARERCCMFEYADAEKAEKEADLAFVEELFESNRHSHELCCCRKCGALVIHQYEELVTFDWDNADCFDRYYPVGSIEEAHELEQAYPFAHLSGRRKHIEVSYTEENSRDKQYRYRGLSFNGK